MPEYPLPDVIIRELDEIDRVIDPSWSGENMHVSQNEYFLDAAGTGQFSVRDGNTVEYTVVPGADPGWVKLYLNGQVVVALLHQRKIITFHASSFIYNGHGIMILGESGAGKSSVTASFALSGAGLLTDDVTPVIIRDIIPFIKQLHGAIRIRKNTAEQLNIGADRLRDAEAGTEKQYLHIGYAGVDDFPLHMVVKIEIGSVTRPEFYKLLPTEKFSLLRSEVCMWEILAGMPETEAAYLQQLLHIVEQVRFVRVVRPAEIEIRTLHAAVKQYLDKLPGQSRMKR